MLESNTSAASPTLLEAGLRLFSSLETPFSDFAPEIPCSTVSITTLKHSLSYMKPLSLLTDSFAYIE